MKRCGRCGDEKPPDEFMWASLATGKKDSYCRSCRAAYKQEHYAKNRRHYIDNAARRTKAMLKQRIPVMIDYLRKHPYVDCGEDDVLVLEFDHIGEKSFGISVGLRARSWDAVLKEMKKCEVVCANCHRRRTARRQGFLKLLMKDA